MKIEINENLMKKLSENMEKNAENKKLEETKKSSKNKSSKKVLKR